MNEEMDIHELFRLMQSQNIDPAVSQTLEQVLLERALDPNRIKKQTIIIDNNLNNEVLYEIRDKVEINNDGHVEEIEELVINAQTFADGSPLNVFGIVRCQNCNSLVQEHNIMRCPCGKTVCLFLNCARYSRIMQKWYCSRTHKLLEFFGIGLR